VNDGFPPVAGVEHRFVEVRGLRMHVAEAGAGEPLLLVHGWPQHWYQWRGVIGRLKGERRLIAPDLRGFGWSDAPPGPIEPDVFADDLIALLDTLGIERTDLAGHDWGGFTSLLLAARHPERFKKVLVFSTPHPWVEITPRLALETWRAWYALVLATGVAPARIAEWFLRHEGVDAAPYVDRLRAPERADATTRLYRSYLRTLGRTVMRRAQEPRPDGEVLLTIGANDQAVTPRLGEGFPRFEILPGAGHFVCDTHAPEVAERIRSFACSG
jgi:pimeloyl-ACP methyl ester carboxylesterase